MAKHSSATIRIDPDAQVGVPLRELAYQIVRGAIQSGYFRPGEHLSEHRLSKELGISRTPVREALSRLEADRWLRRKRSGLIVATLTPAEIVDLFGVRSALETYACRVAAELASQSDVISLREINAQFSLVCQSPQRSERIRLNITFHRQLSYLSQNQLLARMNDELGERMQHLTTLLRQDTQIGKQSALEHEAVIDAIEARDPDRAEKCIRKHLGRMEQTYLEELKKLRVESEAAQPHSHRSVAAD